MFEKVNNIWFTASLSYLSFPTQALRPLPMCSHKGQLIQWFWLRTFLIGAFVWVEGGRGHFPLPAVFRLPHNTLKIGNSKHFYFTSCVRLYQISSSSSAGICRVIYLTISPNMQLAANHSYLFQEILNVEKLLVGRAKNKDCWLDMNNFLN